MFNHQKMVQNLNPLKKLSKNKRISSCFICLKNIQSYLMQSGAQEFQKGNIQKAIEIYGDIIINEEERKLQALLNRASAYYAIAEYAHSMKDVVEYLKTETKPSVNGYILYANCLIKNKQILQQDERDILQKGKQEYPLHKKYIDTLKIVEQLQITENQEEYLEKIFEKLLHFPNLRNYMNEESFLTKVQKMITNPSLAEQLIKIDGRLAQVQQIILMSDG